MLYLSSSCIKATSVLDSIAALSNITKNIELSGGSDSNDNLLGSLKKLKKQGYNFLIHGYFPPPKEHFLLNFADVSCNTREFISRTISLVKDLEVPYYSTHAGFTSDFMIGSNEKLEGGKNIFGYSGVEENINWFFENSSDVGLALENLFPNGERDNCCFWMKPECIIDALQKNERINLLLDFGHLKISAEHFGFDWIVAAEDLLERFADRIKEIHVSENSGKRDEHLPIEKDSQQIAILKKFADKINEFDINVTIEARTTSHLRLSETYNLISKTLEG